MESPRLYITLPSGLARTIDLSGATTLGRDDENDIVLDEATLSLWHALLLARPQGMVLVDLESTNGTLVNGRFIPSDTPMPLEDGDLIALGRVIARYRAGADRHPDTQGDSNGQSNN